MLMNGVNGTSEPRVDLADLAERCRVAGNAVEMPKADAALLGECAEVFEAMRSVIDSTPEMIRQNREHQYVVTCRGVAEALERHACDYEAGGCPIVTPQTALRGFAAALRNSLKPKPEGVVEAKPTLVKGSFG